MNVLLSLSKVAPSGKFDTLYVRIDSWGATALILNCSCYPSSTFLFPIRLIISVAVFCTLSIFPVALYLYVTTCPES